MFELKDNLQEDSQLRERISEVKKEHPEGETDRFRSVAPFVESLVKAILKEEKFTYKNFNVVHKARNYRTGRENLLSAIKEMDLSNLVKQKLKEKVKELNPEGWGDGKMRLYKEEPDNFNNLERLCKELLNTNDEKELDEAVLEYAKNPVSQMNKPARLSTLLYCLCPRNFAVVNSPVQPFLQAILPFKIEKLTLEGYVELNKLFRKLLKDWQIGKEFGMLDELSLKYSSSPPQPPHSSLENIIKACGFYFEPHQIASFYTALKTKGFVILAGLSGTGKTKLAEIFCEVCIEDKKQKLFLSVQPDWRDSTSLIGYYNPLFKKFEPGQIFEHILRALKNWQSENKKPFFVILDEMNLAHVEYYFAEFLSVIESRRDENGLTKEGIKVTIGAEGEQRELYKKIKEIKGVKIENNIAEILLPPNLYFIGTVNIDETTFMFSPKVLDRAFTIEFSEVNFDNYKETIGKLKEEPRKNPEFPELLKDFTNDVKFLQAHASKKEIEKAIVELGDYYDQLKNLCGLLKEHDLHFAYRVIDEIALFYKYGKESKGKIVNFADDDEIVDYAVMMKVLPKFHGNRAKLNIPLKKVLAWARNPKSSIGDIKRASQDENYWDTNKPKTSENKQGIEASQGNLKHTAEKVEKMARKLGEEGYTSYL